MRTTSSSPFTNFKIMFTIIAGIGIIFLGANMYNETVTDTVYDCKVKKLQQQQKISSDGSNNINTEYRYLVVTDKETFICTSSVMNQKFNNSDIFFNLKEDSIYTFRVAGLGKGMFFDYRNIIEVL